MNLEDYDFDRLLALGYTEKATGDLKDACWKGYTAVGLKKKGGRTVPNCVPVNKSKSDHAEEMKRKPLIAGPSAGSPSFGEGKGTGKPCGASHISAAKTCHVGGGAGYKDVTEAIRADMGSSFDDAHEKVFEERYAKAKDTKDLGRIHKKAIKDLDNDDLDAKEGVLNAMKKAMQAHLEVNMASGQGAKREAELAAMTPEERAKARSADAIERGIKNKVVSGRMR
jgi:hypothetical protein